MENIQFKNYSYKGNDSENYSYSSHTDNIIGSVSDLIDDPKYKPFFYKHLYRIGPVRFIEIAEEARKIGVYKGKCFTKLIKKA